MYTVLLAPSTAAPSWLNRPMARRATPGLPPSGSTSHTRPFSTSSHDSHVPHGVCPPAQFRLVPPRIRRASVMAPLWLKRIMPAPPLPVANSELET